MRRALATLILAIAALAGCGGDGASSPPASQGVVDHIYDADSLRLEDGREVRLVQIDAPEVDECYAREATQALVRIAPNGTRVELERDRALDDVDDYDRLLRYLIVDGENVNLELVRRGAAAPYFFRNERGRYAAELLQAAEEARAARRGMWGACPGAELNPGRGSVSGPG